jgi:hypothetical protein
MAKRLYWAGFTALCLTSCATYYGPLAQQSDCFNVKVEVPGAPGGKAATQSEPTELFGIEDLASTLEIGATENPIIFLSATERRDWRARVGNGCDDGRPVLLSRPSDGIFYLSFGELRQALDEKRAAKVAPLALIESTAKDLHPHGITLIKGAGPSEAHLLVINHPSSCRNGGVAHDSSVLKIDMRLDKNLTAVVDWKAPEVLATQDEWPELFCAANDIAALKPTQFFVTHDASSCPNPGISLDELLNPDHYLLYFADRQTPPRRLVSGFGYINGIAVSPDGTALLLADTRGGLYRYSVKQLLTHGSATSGFKLDVPPGLDNLSWGDDGLLYSAAHPNLLKFGLYGVAPWLAGSAPTAILSVDPTSEASPSHRLLAKDDGTRFSAASATLKIKDLSISGAVFDRGLFVCHLGSTS